jgi:hypothetical protein
VSYGLRRTLYDDEHERSSALDALTRSHPYPTDHTESQPHSPSVGNDTRFGSLNEPPTKIAHIMALRFNNRKFSEKLGENLTDFVNDYLETSTDYDLASAAQLQYLHHLFTGEAEQLTRSPQRLL